MNYGVGFFAVLLILAIWFALSVKPYVKDKTVQADYRVIHFRLILALTFSLGAVVIGVLIVVSKMGFFKVS